MHTARDSGAHIVAKGRCCSNICASPPTARRGTVYEIQAVLKRDCASCLDKYQTPKGVRWKLAVSVRGRGRGVHAAGKHPCASTERSRCQVP